MRVLLADSEARIRSALRLLLEQEPDVTAITEVGEAGELVSALKSDAPDVVLFDWHLPGVDGTALLEALRRARADLKVVVLSCRPEERLDAFRAGAHAFVSKTDGPGPLLSTLHHVCEEADQTSP
jgi:DNA-binding NarL/FixJ family response regulator